jgi:hypothetical protein
MTIKTFIYIIESAIWPKSLAGWAVAALIAIGSFFFLSQVYEFSIDYSCKYKWKNTQGQLIDIELTENKRSAHLTYVYKINNDEFRGDKIGVAEHKWYDVNNRRISKFKNIIEKSESINVKYNPKTWQIRFMILISRMFLLL